MVEIRLTRRALSELAGIETESLERFGTKTASAYMRDIEDILRTITEYPNILKERSFATHIRFFPIREHMLVFAVLDDTIYLLTVRYGGMDIERIITQLEPTLLHEAEIMHEKLKKIHSEGKN